jgi:polysaccharide pyruvyl transferase WcaK-like protein
MKRDSTRQKIALFGNFGTGNLGNEATLEAMIYNLRRYLPNAEISCVCVRPESTALDYGISAIPIRAPFPIWKGSNQSSNGDQSPESSNGSISRRAAETHRWSKGFSRLKRGCAYPFLGAYQWRKALLTLKETDLLVMTGTGMVGDYAIGPRDLHYDIFRWAVAAKVCRCKLLFVSVGSGPRLHPSSKRLIKIALALADYRSYRDASSKENLRAIGVDVKDDAVFPDLAFSLPTTVTPKHDLSEKGIVIGVGLMNYHNRLGRSNDETVYRDYLRRVASLVARLLEYGYLVRVLIGDVVWDSDVRQDLKNELEERGLKYEHGRLIDHPASSVGDLLLQLSSVDVVVASRFHNVLLALMLAKPVVAISYHEKFKPLMDGVGLGEFCQDIEHIDVDDLLGKLARLQKNYPSFTLQIARETASFRAALDEQYERIVRIAQGNNQGS